MSVTLDMPKLSDTMSFGTIVKWLKDIDDPIARGEPFADVETDKATMPLISPEDGTLIEILAPVGSRVPVGSPVAKIEQSPISTTEEITRDGFGIKSEENTADSHSSLAAEEIPSSLADDDEDIPPPHTVDEEDMPPPLPDIDHEIIEEEDIQKAILSEDLKTDTIQEIEKSPNLTKKDLGGIGEANYISKARNEYLYLEKEIDISNLLNARDLINAEFITKSSERISKVSLNDFMISSISRAIRSVPEINVTINEGVLKKHKEANISFSIFLSDKVINPVINDASSKSITDIAQETNRLITKAREGKMEIKDEANPTFSMCNLAIAGIDSFISSPIPPTGSSVSIGSQVSKPDIDESGRICLRKKIKLNLVSDNRTVNALVAGAFLNELSKFIENPVLHLLQ